MTDGTQLVLQSHFAKDYEPWLEIATSATAWADPESITMRC